MDLEQLYYALLRDFWVDHRKLPMDVFFRRWDQHLVEECDRRGLVLEEVLRCVPDSYDALYRIIFGEVR